MGLNLENLKNFVVGAFSEETVYHIGVDLIYYME